MSGRRAFITTFVFFFLSVSSSLLATERYVAPPPLGNNSNPGTSELPFATIQHGIDAAANGDTVIVAQGTYVENIRFMGKNIVLTSTDPLDPAIVANTIIDGNQAGSVVTFTGTETEACALSGFTIRNGEAEVGGGISGNRTKAAVRNNIITRNRAAYGGGLAGCHGLIENNVISWNSADESSYVECVWWDPETGECGEWETSWYGGVGGGLDACNGMIRDNVITENAATWDGGGLYWCDGTISDNVITENGASWDGGGLYWCDGTIQNNIIAGNSAAYGGGLNRCNGTVCNNIISGNQTFVSWRPGEGYGGDFGGGLCNCYGTIQSNTVTGNRAAAGGGLFDCDGMIQNCIIWGNDWGAVYESSIPTYSCIEGWTEGGTNIGVDPSFTLAGHWDDNGTPEDWGDDFWVEGDYRLRPHSPCIDAGINEGWMWEALDLEDHPRVFDGDSDGRGVVDMGAYEYIPREPVTWYVDASVLASGNGRTWGTAFKTIQEGINAASNGDTVLVHRGTYVENIKFEGKNIVLRSTDPLNADVVASTIIDGNSAGAVIAFEGTEDETCILSGFTIRKGIGTIIEMPSYPDTYVRCGGGVFGGNPDGVHTHAAIQNNMVCDNTADVGGGMAYCDGVIQDNKIVRNSVTQHGGGLLGCNGTVRNNQIYENSALYGGGLGMCDGEILGNLVTGNSAATGGGLYNCGGTIVDNTISGNRAIGGEYMGLPIAGVGGGLYGCSGTIQNCIVWGNTAIEDDAQIGGSSVPTYSCIQDWTGGGEGNIALDPQFLDADGPDDRPTTYQDNNYRLSDDSPCIDRGTNDIYGRLDIRRAWIEKVDDVSLTFCMELWEPVPTEPSAYTAYIWFLDTDQNPNTGQAHGDIGSERNVRVSYNPGNIGTPYHGWHGYVDFITEGAGTQPLPVEIRENKVFFTLRLPEKDYLEYTIDPDGVFDWCAIASEEASPGQPIGDVAPDVGHSTARMSEVPMNALLSEDFEDAVVDRFTELGGTWAVAGGEYVQSTGDPPGPYRSWVDAGDLMEYTIEVDCTLLSGQATKVIYAHADTREEYRFDLWLDHSRLCVPEWGQMGRTRAFEAGGLSLSYGRTCHVKIEVSLTGVKVWLDDLLQHDQPWANNEPLGDGKIGVGTWAASSGFDNVMVYAAPRNLRLRPTIATVGDMVWLFWEPFGYLEEYVVQYTDDLASGLWRTAPTGPTVETTWSEDITGIGKRFYRVVSP